VREVSPRSDGCCLRRYFLGPGQTSASCKASFRRRCSKRVGPCCWPEFLPPLSPSPRHTTAQPAREPAPTRTPATSVASIWPEQRRKIETLAKFLQEIVKSEMARFCARAALSKSLEQLAEQIGISAKTTLIEWEEILRAWQIHRRFLAFDRTSFPSSPFPELGAVQNLETGTRPKSTTQPKTDHKSPSPAAAPCNALHDKAVISHGPKNILRNAGGFGT